MMVFIKYGRLAMNYLFTLLRSVFEWGLFLALFGGLGEATVTMYKQAAHAHAHGLISLTALNRSLVGDAGLPTTKRTTKER